MTSPTEPIHAKMSVPEIVDNHPETEAVFERYGVRIKGYKALEFENLEATAIVHQLDVQELLKELNQAIQAPTA
jgi:hypothetical protein